MKTCIDLFSGIGGFTLGMQWAGGWRTVQFVERDPFCQSVLRKHWPEVPIHDDITTFDGFRADAVVGGFPCQDISFAGKGAGLAGARSGLWWEMHRVIAQARPRWCIIENVPALRSRGLDTVLRSLDSIGFDAEWHCVPAAAIGARHRRDRIWIVAYAYSDDGPRPRRPAFIQRQVLPETRWQETPNGSEACRAGSNDVSDAAGERRAGRVGPGGVQAREESDVASSREAVPDADRDSERGLPVHAALGSPSEPVSHAIRHGLERRIEAWAAAGAAGRPSDAGGPGWWAVEPSVGRVADGVPARTHRLRALGNAIVPQIARIITETLNDVDTD
jgi:DNA (cytosine-5)-methyltransferase 1